MVHDFINEGLWKDLFDYVFWIPLRELQDFSPEKLEDLLLRKFFRNADRGLIQGQLRKTLSSRILFILDGLDEVSYTFNPNEHRGQILRELLQHDHTIVTSRPHSTNAFISTLPDLELETIGFFPTQVEEYLEAAGELTPETRSSIRSFIQMHPIVGGLVRIPIQLDALCYCWGGTFAPTDITTMTTLYKDIETKLWEKYITLRDHPTTLSQVQGAAVIRQAVKEEISFLEQLGFSGLLNRDVEFDANYLSKASTGQISMYNHNLVYNSFLRSSSNPTKPERQSYHFIHLTFQEYFAARHFVHHWISGKEIALLRDTKRRRLVDAEEHITPREFLLREKYSARYDIFWRFVVGLLQEEGNDFLQQFFETLENEPRDLLGPSHQRLIIHCLNEVYLPDDQLEFQARLIDEYLQWMLFEYRITSECRLGQETECPDRIFVSLLQGSLEDRQIAMESLRYRLIVSPEILTMVLGELKRESDSRIRQMAYYILGANCHQTSGQQFVDFWQNLPHLSLADRQEAASSLYVCPLQHLAIKALVQLLEDKDSDVQSRAALALRGQSQLPPTVIKALVQLLEDKNSYIRSRAAYALSGQSQLPTTVIEALIQLVLKDKDSLIRSYAANTLSGQSQLPTTVVDTLAQLLEDKDSYIRSYAAIALSGQSQLPPTVVDTLAQLLEDKDSHVRYYAADALSGQSRLLPTVIKTLIQLLEDKNSYVRSRAADALSGQSQLPQTVVNTLVQLLKDEDFQVRSSAAYTLGRQSQLPPTVVDTLVQLLKDKNEDKDVRSCVAHALSGQSQLLPTVVEALVQLVLKDEDFEVRSGAAIALGSQSQLSPKALETMLLFSPQAIWDRRIISIFHDRKELYALLPRLNIILTQNLFAIWVRESFRVHRACYFDGHTVYMNLEAEPVRRISLRTDQLETLKSINSKLSR